MTEKLESDGWAHYACVRCGRDLGLCNLTSWINVWPEPCNCHPVYLGFRRMPSRPVYGKGFKQLVDELAQEA